ncbi:MAG: hypothetical protein KC474_10995 [Cyanobacteria bacterium HKST-UBA04]|nr:hypothetical protein [Cyanobacteria bacterium HKST-UBA04]
MNPVVDTARFGNAPEPGDRSIPEALQSPDFETHRKLLEAIATIALPDATWQAIVERVKTGQIANLDGPNMHAYDLLHNETDAEARTKKVAAAYAMLGTWWNMAGHNPGLLPYACTTLAEHGHLPAILVHTHAGGMAFAHVRVHEHKQDKNDVYTLQAWGQSVFNTPITPDGDQPLSLKEFIRLRSPDTYHFTPSHDAQLNTLLVPVQQQLINGFDAPTFAPLLDNLKTSVRALYTDYKQAVLSAMDWPHLSEDQVRVIYGGYKSFNEAGFRNMVEPLFTYLTKALGIPENAITLDANASDFTQSVAQFNPATHTLTINGAMWWYRMQRLFHNHSPTAANEAETQRYVSMGSQILLTSLTHELLHAWQLHQVATADPQALATPKSDWHKRLADYRDNQKAYNSPIRLLKLWGEGPRMQYYYDHQPIEHDVDLILAPVFSHLEQTGQLFPMAS